MGRKKTRSNGKTRINIRVPAELDEWIKKYAEDHNTNMTKLIVDYFAEIRRKSEEGHVPQL
jgi:uncharacterized protein (DUF1778 family)